MREDGAPGLSGAARGIEDERGRGGVHAVPGRFLVTARLIDEQGGLEMRQNLVSLVGGEKWVERSHRRAQLERAPERCDELPTVGKQERDRVARTDAEARELAGRPARSQVEPAPREHAAVPDEGGGIRSAACHRIEQ